MAEYEGRTYASWLEHVDQLKRLEFTTAAGRWYQARVEAIWDDKPGGAIRVFLAVDDGGVGAYSPMTDSLLVQPPDSPRNR